MDRLTLGLVHDVRKVLREHGVDPDTVTLLKVLEQVVASGVSPRWHADRLRA